MFVKGQNMTINYAKLSRTEMGGLESVLLDLLILKLELVPGSQLSPTWNLVFLKNNFFLKNMSQEKLQNKAHINIGQYVLIGNVQISNLKPVFKQKVFESFFLSATNEIFLPKGG